MIDMPATDALRRIRRVALGDFIHRSALKFGERTAVVDGDTRLNYRELDARSSRFAHHLIGTIGRGRQVEKEGWATSFRAAAAARKVAKKAAE